MTPVLLCASVRSDGRKGASADCWISMKTDMEILYFSEDRDFSEDRYGNTVFQ